MVQAEKKVSAPVVFPASEWRKVSDGLPRVFAESGVPTQLFWVDVRRVGVCGPARFYPALWFDRLWMDTSYEMPTEDEWRFPTTGARLASNAVTAYAPYHAPEPPRWNGEG